MADKAKAETTPSDFVPDSKKSETPAALPKEEGTKPASTDQKEGRKFPFWYGWANSSALSVIALIAGVLAGLLLWAIDASSVVMLVGGFIAAFLAHGQARSWVTWPYPQEYVDQVRAEQAKSGQQAESSVREVVDTVVFVIVLVLMLKSFVAEAFIIPTGSMADTLFGYQKQVECPSCGFVSPLNANKEADPEGNGGGEAQRVDRCWCQNCRQEIVLSGKQKKPAYDPKGTVTIQDPGWESGDRVIVVKYLYDVREPRRHDVVVFKYPEKPQEKHVQQNYIKRLIGLPGETIILHGGDAYRVPADKNEKFDDSKFDANDLWKPKFLHVRYQDEVSGKDVEVNGLSAKEFFFKMKDEKRLEIIRKRPEALLAMRRLVHDNNHPAKDLKDEKNERGEPRFQRWTHDAKSLWQPAGEHGFRHTAGGSTPEYLTYHHRLRGYNGEESLITDFLSYNSFEHLVAPGRTSPLFTGQNWVGDLIVECKVSVEKADGDFVLELTRSGERFEAKWDLATGKCTLLRDGKPLTLGDGQPAVAQTDLKGGKHNVRFANFDQRLTVWVDGELPFGDGVAYAPPVLDRGPTGSDFQPARIGVRGGDVQVDDVQLWRDTYYTVIVGLSEREKGLYDTADADRHVRNWTKNGDWSTQLRDLPTCTTYVQPGHYLCLGDNSVHSKDSRAWGTVPKRLMLGRALSVYWPFARFGRIR